MTNETAHTPDFHALNRDKLIERFQGGAKYAHTLGFELEHILVRAKTGEPVNYEGPRGVREILERMRPFYDTASYEGDALVGLSRSNVVISIEPAGQLEISAGPFSTVIEIEQAYCAFRAELDPILEEFGVEAPMLGYHPTTKASDLQLVPKFRYACMDRYLGAEADEARHMMRATASLQVSIDYENEADAMRKMRIAQIIAPILAFMCDNSPMYEGAPRKRNMVRTGVWSAMNPDRVGTVPGSLRESFSFAAYADYILSRKAILVPDAQDEHGWRYVGGTTFDEVYADREMTDAEIEHALSMVWPDVRLKNFLEIRPADAMPIEYALAYVLLVKNLFYSKRNLDVLDVLLQGITEDHVRQAKVILMDDGYGAEIYGRSIEFWVDQLLVLASSAWGPGEFIYLEPILSMKNYRFTLADVYEKRRHLLDDPVPPQANAPVIGVVPRYDFEWTGLSIGDGYLSGLLEAGGIPIVLPLVADAGYIDQFIKSCDGFLIPGGQDIDPSTYGCAREPRTHRAAYPRDAMERALIIKAVEAGKPILGVCRGMQAINVALGGNLVQDIGVVHPDSTFDHVQGRPFDMPAHMVDVVPGTKLADAVGALRLGVNTIHHQSVGELGKGLVVSAVSPDDGVVEGIELAGEAFVVGVQWHPEHMWRTRPHSKRLFGAFIEAAKARREQRS